MKQLKPINKTKIDYRGFYLIPRRLFAVVIVTLFVNNGLDAQNPNEVSQRQIAEYIHWYPAIEQVKMRDEWLKKHEYGQWQISGLVTANDRTVITPQADVNYGYSWFNITDQPIVATMPKYDKYYAMSIFDMNHFSQVVLAPEKPVVVRLPHQKSPLEDAIEIVLHTNQGLIFTRQVVVGNEAEVLDLAKKISISGGGGDAPFIVPDFTEEEAAAGDAIIQEYALTKVTNARKLFGTVYEGIGDLDRAAGVFLGQLGTQSYVVDYQQYLADQFGEPLNGTDNYELVVPTDALMKNDKGYWSLTVYSMEDRYLIPNDKGIYVMSSYAAMPNSDNTTTIRINPKGEGVNAIPNAGQMFYAVFRVYEPVVGVEFPPIKKVD